MSHTTKKLIYWSPRILSIFFALFLSLFAFDVFQENTNFWRSLIAFLIHLIPSFLVIIALILAWKREWIGTVLSVTFSIWYVIVAYGKFPIFVYFLICGPMILIAVLFLINWIYRKDIRGAQ